MTGVVNCKPASPYIPPDSETYLNCFLGKRPSSSPQTGLEVVIRYSLELEHAAEIDGEITRSRLKVVSSLTDPSWSVYKNPAVIGTKLAHYEILTEIFTENPERIARRQREARVLASLNHLNIAVIYGIDEALGRNFLVMELVPGETLAERIA